jgi:CRP-like cAMP-binding protein
MSIEVNIIKALDFFYGLSQDQLDEFAAVLKPTSVEKGDVIIRKGTPALTFYIILAGVYEVTFEAGPSVTIDKKGEILGWSTVVAPFHYTGTVVAQAPGELLYLSSQDFFELIQNNNELGERIMKKIDKVAQSRRALAKGLH